MLPQIPDPFTTFGPLSARTFPLLMALAFAICLAGAIHSQRHRLNPAAVCELAIIALILSLAGARMGHVWLHQDYFAGQPAEILRLRQGGLNWHGALLGAWLAITICRRAPRWHALDFPALAHTLSFTIPLFTFAAWRACASALCAYGREVDTLYGLPAWFADWSADIFTRIAPRYHTASLGQLLATGMLIAAWLLWRRSLPAARRLSVIIAMLAAGMWAMGQLRGDPLPTLAGQRADQWLDLLVMLAALIALLRPHSYKEETWLSTT